MQTYNHPSLSIEPQGPVVQGADPLQLVMVLLLLLFVILTTCVGGSYLIARARWRTMMELRERHSPSRKPDDDELW